MARLGLELDIGYAYGNKLSLRLNDFKKQSDNFGQFCCKWLVQQCPFCVNIVVVIYYSTFFKTAVLWINMLVAVGIARPARVKLNNDIRLFAMFHALILFS